MVKNQINEYVNGIHFVSPSLMRICPKAQHTRVHTHAQMYMQKWRCSHRKLINSSSIINQGEVSWVMSQVVAAFSAALTSVFYILSQPLYDFITKKPPEKNSHQSLLFASSIQPDLISRTWIKSGLKVKSVNLEFKINPERLLTSCIEVELRLFDVYDTWSVTTE